MEFANCKNFNQPQHLCSQNSQDSDQSVINAMGELSFAVCKCPKTLVICRKSYLNPNGCAIFSYVLVIVPQANIVNICKIIRYFQTFGLYNGVLDSE